MWAHGRVMGYMNTLLFSVSGFRRLSYMWSLSHALLLYFSVPYQVVSHALVFIEAIFYHHELGTILYYTTTSLLGSHCSEIHAYFLNKYYGIKKLEKERVGK